MASGVSFGLDLLLLWLLVAFLGLQYLLAATVGFLVAVTLHYALSRLWIFRDSGRHVASGYVYFLIIAGVGLALTLAVLWLLVEWVGLHYLLARVAASAVGGTAMFFLNAGFNFKRL